MKLNMTSIVMLMNSLPKDIPPEIPLHMKIGILVIMVIISYINRYCYLEKKISQLEKNVIEMESEMAAFKNTISTMRRMLTDAENKISVVENSADFLLTNTTQIQKALYKKLEIDEKFRTGKVLTKDRQQAYQEYALAKMSFARRCNELLSP